MIATTLALHDTWLRWQTFDLVSTFWISHVGPDW